MVNLELLDAHFYARVVRTREEAREVFHSVPDEERMILMLDLASSTNHRFFRGPAEAYQRTVVFYKLCESIFAYASRIQVLKEMGDGILATALDEAEALEACFLLKRSEQMIRREFPDESFPFGIRIGLAYGPVRRLTTPRPDYLGSAIDGLSRIMMDKSVDAGILLSRSFQEHVADTLHRYPFAHLGPMRWWADESSSLTHPPIEYYELGIDLDGMPTQSTEFQTWDSLAGTRAPRQT